MKILPLHDLIDIPWKNGGGITRNIATGMINQELVWRISRADVDVEGPFSSFEGLTRILTVVSQNTMDLLHADGALQARPWTPVQFDGGLKVSSRLKDGPLTDLNLMFDPKLCTGTAKVQKGPTEITPPPAGSLIVLHVLDGAPESAFAAGDNLFLEGTPLTTSNQARVELGSKDTVLLLELSPLDQSADIKLVIADL